MLKNFSISLALFLWMASAHGGTPEKKEEITKALPRIATDFLRYVAIDTQSKEGEKQIPSTRKQCTLARILADDLKRMKVRSVEVDKHCYVFATVPSTAPEGIEIPTIGFIGHLDTSPDAPGANVKPQIVLDYNGGEIELKGTGEKMSPKEYSSLSKYKGQDLITSDGTTLLGADNKAGIAAIMAAVREILTNTSMPHGKVRVLLAPDEEVWKGVEALDIKKFGVDFAYTVDGGSPGNIATESFFAERAIFKVKGFNTHPGYAKGKLVNAVRVASSIINRIPKSQLPETTSGKQGYFYPYELSGTSTTDEAALMVLLRDFDQDRMEWRKRYLERIRQKTLREFPGATIDLEVQHQYDNLGKYLSRDPRVADFAIEAVRRAGLEPKKDAIRGGTDGCDLSERGLLTPDIFAGEENIHSTHEYVSIQAMEQSAATIRETVYVWAEKAVQAGKKEPDPPKEK